MRTGFRAGNLEKVSARKAIQCSDKTPAFQRVFLPENRKKCPLFELNFSQKSRVYSIIYSKFSDFSNYEFLQRRPPIKHGGPGILLVASEPGLRPVPAVLVAEIPRSGRG